MSDLFPTQNDLRQEAQSSLPFKIGHYEGQEYRWGGGQELNGAHQLLVYADKVKTY